AYLLLAGVVFQVEAPIVFNVDKPNPKHLYQLEVELDGQRRVSFVALNPASCVSNFYARSCTTTFWP
ncbi:hypothetical protein ACFSF3_01375, partial [Vibrio chagasii]